jgi:hypothetical protein
MVCDTMTKPDQFKKYAEAVEPVVYRCGVYSSCKHTQDMVEGNLLMGAFTSV